MLPTYITLLRLTWRQYLNRFDLVLYGHICFSLPIILGIAYLKEWFPVADTITTTAELWPNFMIQLGLDQLAVIASSIVTIILVMGMRRALQQQSTKFTDVLREAMPFYLPMVLLSTIVLILTLCSLTLFIVPGILIAVLFTFATPALAWHRLSVMQAIRRSVQLVRGQFWRIFLYVMTVQLLLMAVILLITWGLPVNFYFDIFADWIASICASFLIVFVTIMMNATETLAVLLQKTVEVEQQGIAEGAEKKPEDAESQKTQSQTEGTETVKDTITK